MKYYEDYGGVKAKVSGLRNESIRLLFDDYEVVLLLRDISLILVRIVLRF